MDKETLLVKLHEFTLFVTTITSATELMNCYAMRQDDRQTKLIGEFLREFALGSADEIDEFDEYIRREGFSLILDEAVLPPLIAYIKAKVRFSEIVEELRDDEILSAELIGSLTRLS